MMERLPENDTEFAIFQNNIKYMRKKRIFLKKIWRNCYKSA